MCTCIIKVPDTKKFQKIPAKHRTIIIDYKMQRIKDEYCVRARLGDAHDPTRL